MFIYHWDNFSDKSKCFDYGDFIFAREIEDNIGVDAGNVPTLIYNIPMRDSGDSGETLNPKPYFIVNKIWT